MTEGEKMVWAAAYASGIGTAEQRVNYAGYVLEGLRNELRGKKPKDIYDYLALEAVVAEGDTD